MTRKEEYEARKAERKIRKNSSASQPEADQLELMNILDRFVTAVERIADAMEK